MLSVAIHLAAQSSYYQIGAISYWSLRSADAQTVKVIELAVL